MVSPNRKSLNFALFSTFLRRLETTSTSSAPSGYLLAELVQQLRLASLELAMQRVNEEWARVAAREGRTPPRMHQAPDATFYVTLANGEQATLAPVEYDDLKKHHERVVRGLPELRGTLA